MMGKLTMLQGTDHALDDSSVVMILMNSIPENYQIVKDAFQYTGTVPSYDLFCSALRTRELELKNQKNKSGANLFVKNSKSGYGNDKNKKNKNKAKDNNTETRKCYHVIRFRFINRYLKTGNAPRISSKTSFKKNSGTCQISSLLLQYSPCLHSTQIFQKRSIDIIFS